MLALGKYVNPALRYRLLKTGEIKMRMRYTLAFQKKLPNPHPDVRTEAKRFRVLVREAIGLFITKNNVYRNQFLDDGLAGVVVRLRDKLRRVAQVQGQDESLVEDLLDISIYALMGAMIVQFASECGSPCCHLYAEDDSELRCILCDDIAK